MMRTSLKIKEPLVSVDWLCRHKDATNLVVLNGTMSKVSSKKERSFIETTQIPNARFFDLQKVFSMQEVPYPNTSLEPKVFQTRVRDLGIRNDSCIVVYDEHGIYSSPRVWWLFKTMGFDNIAVLNGGFPAWKLGKGLVEKKVEHFVEKGDFTVRYNMELLLNADQVFIALSDTSKQIIDARSSARFFATEPEPRQGIRRGHIPGSKSLPYTEVLVQGEFKSITALQELFSEVDAVDKALIFSCGSGVTACILALGASLAGYERVAVYDGSWSEWGSIPELPIKTL